MSLDNVDLFLDWVGNNLPSLSERFIELHAQEFEEFAKQEYYDSNHKQYVNEDLIHEQEIRSD
jgi:hypothetical protein